MRIYKKNNGIPIQSYATALIEQLFCRRRKELNGL